jgi:hypothetical protein
MSDMGKILKLAKDIKSEINKGVEDYHTGLLGEQMIVASYQTMPVEKLEAMRYIINKIIKKKKEYMRVQNAKANSVNNDGNCIPNNEAIK